MSFTKILPFTPEI